MNWANMCLSTGSASTLSVEFCVSSYKHLLWRVQGPLFTEHLFSQMILLLSPGQGRTTASPPYCDLSEHAVVQGFSNWGPGTTRGLWRSARGSLRSFIFINLLFSCTINISFCSTFFFCTIHSILFCDIFMYFSALFQKCLHYI